MLSRACVKPVIRQSINLGVSWKLSAKYTSTAAYPTNQVFFMHLLYNNFEQLISTNKHPLNHTFKLLYANLYTFSTIPTNTNK